ncbi:TetR/AcrR family transcriptional regulator [Ottowia sp. GY511]|uniref:TetR/AcrR family transcriptional regulator n=1 Tax=Ottowia flava TaxID=2675430 RepID=A0ABW4KWZ3_9BURK|nr:TetR/AcrR family transcriptional regulator [Ottowia sp. GY511]TXK27274.1 TetR/AcrR family transcriptional regulator [Ottowia sp. GY511]
MKTLKPRAASASGRQKAATAGTDAKRERILATAERLFHEQGYAQTTMEQIVSALGVTKPYVYYYFRNKQEIFETLSWAPAVDCFTSMDFAADDARPAHEKVMDGLERLIRATISHHPAAFFFYREPQVYRPEYRAAQKKVADHFYEQLCALLEQGRREGHFDFDETRVTAQAACSLPGFLYHWYRPDGRLSPEEMVAELTGLAGRVLGLRATPRARSD